MLSIKSPNESHLTRHHGMLILNRCIAFLELVVVCKYG